MDMFMLKRLKLPVNIFGIMHFAPGRPQFMLIIMELVIIPHSLLPVMEDSDFKNYLLSEKAYH